MKRILFLFFGVIFGVISAEAPTVLVSVAPFSYLVKEIAKDSVNVIAMVPPMANAHTYEPTPKEIMKASVAKVWFTMGEPFEKKAVSALKGFRPEMRIVDLRKGVTLIYDKGCSCCHGEGGADLHFWLSPKENRVVADTIAAELIALYPENEAIYRANVEKLKENLTAVEKEIEKIVAPFKGRTIMVAHPAYAYFCRDFGLFQLPIEQSGKDPTAKQLNAVIKKAEEDKIQTIFVQKQFSNKGAYLIAKQMHAKVVTLEPYDEDLPKSLLEIAHQFAESYKE